MSAFTAAPDARWGSSRRAVERLRPAAITVAIVGLATVAQMLRYGPPGVWRSVWAEDGAVFYTDALRHGLGALFHTYTGYYQLAPRLLAIPTPWMPIGWLSAYAAVASAAVTALLGLAVFRLGASAIPSLALRVALGAAVCLHPILVEMPQDNLTNVIWPLTFACFWAVVARPVRRTDVVLACTVGFLAVMSQVLAVLFVPLAVVVAIRRRDRASYWVLGALAVGSALQGVAVVAGESTRMHSSELTELPRMYAARVAGPALFGPRWMADLWESWGDSISYLAILVLAVGVTVLMTRVRADARFVAGAAIASSMLVFGVAVFYRGTSIVRLLPIWTAGFGRFNAVGVLLLLSGLYVLVANASVPPVVTRVMVAVLVLQLVVISVFPLRYRTARVSGPSWQREVPAVREACRHLPERKLISIRVAVPRFWWVTLRCRELLDA